MANPRKKLLTGLAMLSGLAVATLFEAAYVRKNTPRLPAADGSNEGIANPQQASVRLLVLGESSAVGVGVRTCEEGLAAQLARALSDRIGRAVEWKAIGRIGATVRDTNNEFCLALQSMRSDVAVITLGVNDTVRLSTPSHWYRELRKLVRTLQQCAGCRLIVISPVPPLWKFRCLPQPLRGVIGIHAFLLDRISRLVASADTAGAMYVPVPFGDQQLLLATDRFHPSRAGYGVWAEYLACAIAVRLAQQPSAQEL